MKKTDWLGVAIITTLFIIPLTALWFAILKLLESKRKGIENETSDIIDNSGIQPLWSETPEIIDEIIHEAENPELKDNE